LFAQPESRAIAMSGPGLLRDLQQLFSSSEQRVLAAFVVR
jgi:hypothetical protein